METSGFDLVVSAVLSQYMVTSVSMEDSVRCKSVVDIARLVATLSLKV